MSPFVPSLLSQIAASAYVLVGIMCFCASAAAMRFPRSAWHWRAWALVGVIFLLFALMRFFSVEEVLRDELRSSLHAQSSYGERGNVQRAFLAGFLVICSFPIIYFIISKEKNLKFLGSATINLAVLSCSLMIILMIIRTISWHDIDKILYGPLKINWFLDLGLTCATLCFAVIYAYQAFQPPRKVLGRDAKP